MSSNVVGKIRKTYLHFFKRLFDIVISFIAILLFSPIFLIIILFVKLNIGSPIFFKQKRIGLNEKEFTIFKFRTMTNSKDLNGNFLPDKERLTKFGRFLRSTSLDEIPELFNILNGDMSLVGPRPLMPIYLPYYTSAEKKRHSVRPGLTGLAQISGRSFLTWEEIFNYDLKYVSNITFFGDVGIILLTIIKVFSRKNIVDVTQAKYDNSGNTYFIVDGKRMTLHKPLHIERKDTINEKRNR